MFSEPTLSSVVLVIFEDVTSSSYIKLDYYLNFRVCNFKTFPNNSLIAHSKLDFKFYI